MLMQTNINEILKNKINPKIITVFGEEEFLAEQTFKSIINHYSKSDDEHYNLDILDGEEIELNKLIEICQSFPMMSDNRTVAIKRFEKLVPIKPSKAFINNSMLSNYLDNPAEFTTLIILCDITALNGISKEFRTKAGVTKAEKKISSTKFPYNRLIGDFHWIEHPKVWENELPEWINNRFSKFGKTISFDAVELFLSQSTISLRYLNSEIEKVLLYIQDKQNIDVNDIAEIIGSSREYNVFELQKQVGIRSISGSLRILQNMLATNNNGVLIITMLARYFMTIWKMKEIETSGRNNYDLAREIGINPFYLNEYIRAASRYSSPLLN